MRWTGIGALLMALAVAAGAFGAHGLEDRLSAEALDLWETAARYLAYAALTLMAMGVSARVGEGVRVRVPALLLALGAALFSGTVFALALGGPRYLGAITPLGGAAMIAGLTLYGWKMLRNR